MEKSQKGTVEIEKLLNASVEQVWSALTDPAKMKKWYFDVSGFKPELGNEFSFKGGPPDKVFVHRCKIVEIVPLQSIAYTWRYEGYEGLSTVRIELTSQNGKTKLKLTHSKLDSFPGLPDFAIQNFEKGWTEIIGRLLPDFVGRIQD